MIICWGLDTNTHHMMTFSTSHLGQNIYHGCLTHLKSCAGSAQSRLANDANDAVEADFQSSDLNFMNLPFRVACDRKISLKFLHGFNLSAVVCCVSGSHHQDDQKQDISQARHAALPGPAGPACHAWADASSQCIAGSFVIFYCAAVLTILHETKYRNEDIGKSTTFLSRSLWLWYLSLF